MGSKKGFYRGLYTGLPDFLKRRINPIEAGIETFVRSAASVATDRVVIDAGAGESRYRHLFSSSRYLSIDCGVGDADWDYSTLDIVADLHAIPFAGETADLVLNLQVLEHVADPRSVVAEFYRVLKPGGRLFLTAPQGWPEHQPPHDYFRFTRFALDLLLREAGFEEIRVERMGGYFHYLGHRASYLGKILFWRRTGILRLLLFPLELFVLFVFSFLVPLICYYLDWLDRTEEFTLGYRCLAVKPQPKTP